MGLRTTWWTSAVVCHAAGCDARGLWRASNAIDFPSTPPTGWVVVRKTLSGDLFKETDGVAHREHGFCSMACAERGCLQPCGVLGRSDAKPDLWADVASRGGIAIPVRRLMESLGTRELPPGRTKDPIHWFRPSIYDGIFGTEEDDRFSKSVMERLAGASRTEETVMVTVLADGSASLGWHDSRPDDALESLCRLGDQALEDAARRLEHELRRRRDPS